MAVIRKINVEAFYQRALNKAAERAAERAGTPAIPRASFARAAKAKSGRASTPAQPKNRIGIPRVGTPAQQAAARTAAGLPTPGAQYPMPNLAKLPATRKGVTPLGVYPVIRQTRPKVFTHDFPEAPGKAPGVAPAGRGGISHEFPSREPTGHALGVSPAPGGTGWQLLADHFSIPHSGNDGGPFAQFGQVWFNHADGKYYLGLSFIGGKRYRYERQPFDTSMAVINSLSGYTSISWACNPKSVHYDGARFGPGNYTRC